MSELAANGNTISCEIQKNLIIRSKNHDCDCCFVSCSCQKKGTASKQHRHFWGFQAEDHFENYKNTCNHKNSTFQKKIKILKTLELLPTRVECYNTISRPNDGIQKLKKPQIFSSKSKILVDFLFKFSYFTRRHWVMILTCLA